MDPDQVAAHAEGMQKALDLRGDRMAPSSRLESKVAAAARSAGIDATHTRALDEMGRMVWRATVDSGRGRASRTIFVDPAELEGKSIEELEAIVDAVWVDAFRELGLLD